MEADTIFLVWYVLFKTYSLESPTKKPPLPERKYIHEPIQKELLAMITEKDTIKDQVPPPIITPPPYQSPSASNIIDSRPPYESHQIQDPSKHLISSKKLNEIPNPPPLDFQHLELNKKLNLIISVSFDMLDDEDRPHRNEVTNYDTQSIENYKV